MRLSGGYSDRIQISGIGAVQIVVSRRARRVRITVLPFQDVRVTVPVGMSFRRVEKFILQKKDWITSARRKVSEMESARRDIESKFPHLDEKDARRILSSRLKELADMHGFEYQKVIFRKQKTRWGSCSAKNHISLNLQLARLPNHLIDYVLLHELLHTRIKNHSLEFWRAFEMLIDHPREIRAELNRIALI